MSVLVISITDPRYGHNSNYNRSIRNFIMAGRVKIYYTLSL